MGERKVLNRYVPPDFDPSIIPKFKRDRTKLAEVRMMLPFSLRCNTCSEYMYRGKKFNSKKETIMDEDYMGIRKIRFYIKCSVCSAEITFKTDPKNADYECETGASRNFELWRDTQQALEEDAKEREDEEQDAMKALEHKTMDNKMEMDVLDALDAMKAINQRHRRVDTDKVLEAIAKKQTAASSSSATVNRGLTEEDEALIKSIKFGQRSSTNNNHSSSGGSGNDIVDTESNALSQHPDDADTMISSTDSIVSKLQKQIAASVSATPSSTTAAPVVIIKKKRKVDDIEKCPVEEEKKSQKTTDDVKEPNDQNGSASAVGEHNSSKKEDDDDASSNAGGLGGLLMGYGEDSD